MGNDQRLRSSRAWRVVTSLVSLGMLAWGAAAIVYSGATGARAGSESFRDVETYFLVEQDGEWYTVRVDFFMFDDGTGSFDADAAAARAGMLARFPNAVEVPEGSPEAAYVTSGFKWMSGTASWGYNSAGAPAPVSGSAGAALQAAAATWAQQGAAFSFSGGFPSANGTGACGGGTDGSNTVGWGPQGGSVLAVTCSWFGGAGNPYKPAVEFDMQIDPDWNWTTANPVEIDLQSVALHEFGHALGLNHSASSSAVMYASYGNGSIKRTPAGDDVNGILAIYPAGGGPANTPTSTPSPTPTPTRTPTPPGGATPTSTTPTATPTRTPTLPAGGGGNPTPPLPTSTPTPGSGGGANPTPPLATSTPQSPTATPPPATPTPSRSPSPGSSLPILPGANLLAWPADDLPPSQALAGVPNLRIVYAYDPVTGHWARYLPGAPGYLNNLALLKKGLSYWFIATGSTQIAFEP